MGLHGKCIVIGDINLDYIRWNNPETFQERMVDLVKNRLEIDGFVQLIGDHTRTMRHQTDSLLDHIWSNCQERTVSIFNVSRGDSDHNVIGMIVATKDIKFSGHNVMRRSWKHFDKNRCLDSLKALDWNSILLETNPDTANSLFEDMVNSVMDVEAPLRTMQQRKHYVKWLTQGTKDLMQDRDMARESAKLSGSNDEWDTYKFLRNAATKAQRSDKKQHLTNIYTAIEDESDPAKLFSTTKHLLGWSSSGPPTHFVVGGQTVRTQEEVAETLSRYYADKVMGIKMSLPRVNIDPLGTLKRMFSRWEPPTVRRMFSLKTVTVKQVEEMIANLKN